MNKRFRGGFFVRGWHVVLSAACALSAAHNAAAQTTAPFTNLDNVEGSLVRLASVPIRPMVLVGSDLWAVNQHDSKLERFTGTSTAPTVFDVPWDPVSVAYWQGTTSSSSDDEIVVVSHGSWSIAGLDYATGEVKWLLQTRPGTPQTASHIGEMAEPADIVIDSSLTGTVRHRAFVSCPGANSVVQIDLAATGGPAIQRVFEERAEAALANGSNFQCKAPLFLSLETTSGASKVLVAPQISGNNSTWGGDLTHGTTVLDLTASGVVTPLPDNDLFRITPFRSSTAPGRVDPVARRTGTILFAQGIHPTTGELWQLNTEANNKDATQQGEPNVTGRFSFDRITFVPTPFALASGVGQPNSGTTTRSLSPSSMSPPDPSPVSTGQEVGQPCALAFNSQGQAFITGLLTDNVAVLDGTSHALLLEFNLNNTGTNYRAIPRGIVIKATTSSTAGDVLVYCWGRNEIQEFHYDITAGTGTLTRTYTMSYDPSGRRIIEGRSLFFDGTKSAFGNLSCASCHIDGGSDMLVWNLSNLPHSGPTTNSVRDSKGGMFTQTLIGLRRVAPFHWRGERRLVDFNRFAFPGLLGAATPLQETDATHAFPQDFDFFEAYLMSLTNPANPNENRDRVVDDTIRFFDPFPTSPPVTSAATNGQTKFLNDELFPNRMRCADCHAMPVGTLNDINMEQETGTMPRRSHMKAAPFHELWRKRQSTVQIQVSSSAPVANVGFLGSGLSHTGMFPDLFDFVHTITLATTSSADQNSADVTSFLHQLDTGLAPAVHFAFRLDDNTSTTLETAELNNHLIAQALLGNCDVAVFGVVKTSSTTSVHARWMFDPNTGNFTSDQPTTLGTRTLSSFTNPTFTGESNVFIGLPVGMAERFAVDADLDGMANLVDTNGATTPFINTSDTTPPSLSFTGAHPVAWKTARAARLFFQFDEPATAIVRYWRVGSTQVFEATSPRLSRRHAVMLMELEPSTVVGNPADSTFSAVDMAYEMEIESRDLAGNSTTDQFLSPSTFSSAPFITPFDGGPDPIFGPETIFQPVGGGSLPANIQHRQMHHEHILTALSVDGVYNGTTGDVDVTVQATVAFKRGGDFSGGAFVHLPAPDRTVIGHLLRRDPATKVVTDITNTFSPTSDAMQVATVQLQSTSFGLILDVDGDDTTATPSFLVSSVLSNSSGAVSMTFPVPGAQLTLGDELEFVVDAVVEVFDDPNTTNNEWTDALNNASTSPFLLLLPTKNPAFASDAGKRRAFNQWSFPDTKEVNAVAEGTVH